MNTAELLAAAREYDPTIEWTSDEECGPLYSDDGSVQWQVYANHVIRSEGCYDQSCDADQIANIPRLMRAMDAAAKALNEAMK